MELSERKYKILQAIIDDYIQLATPVGSRTISRKYLGLSSATIRNEMSDLEEMGYLDSPHTSAGRIPSIKAYRLYVDNLMEISQLSDEDRKMLAGGFETRSRQIKETISQVARVLSDATRYTSIVVAPLMRELRIRHVQLVPVTEDSALMVVVTNSGIVKDIMVGIPPNFDDAMLHGISRMLTEKLTGRRLAEIYELCEDMRREMNEATDIFVALVRALSRQQRDYGEIVLGGAANILNFPEYSDPEKAKAFLSVLETRDKLQHLFDQGSALEFSIRIGPENGLEEMKDCSVVTATYHVGGENHGSIGIIGPTRMDYSRVVSVLGYMGRALSDMLSGNER